MAISDYFIRYLERRTSLTDEDRERLAALQTENVRFASGDIIVAQDQIVSRSCMMLRGMSARVHFLNGRTEARVITALHVPGDFIDLHGFLLAGLEHSVVAVGNTDVEFIGHDQLREITETSPHLTRLLWMSTTIDAAIHRQWLVAAASLRSSAHLAHLLCEIYTRLSVVGVAHDYRFTMPLLQRELAEILGYSPIHINRAVRDLRERGLLRWHGSEIELPDWQGLVSLARFRPDYLDLEQIER
ncbi:MAG: Crp/Fnr family transcriptional regulator [Paracoccus sp. (in: a-proteobacteria)]|nr:Crp/Fnr family transcriptional regulator [Paracoccus sp. (in: a-proteobacteria)]